MSKKNDDAMDFSSLFKDARPVTHDRYIAPIDEKKRRLQSENKVNKAKIRAQQEIRDKAQLQASIELSDSYEAYWPDNKPLKYINDSFLNASNDGDRRGISFTAKDILKKLSLGHFPPDIEIDLHGQTSREAKAELLAVIFEATKRHYQCINIIHGHGNGTLKHKIPNWLVQHPDVAGFVQAPRSYGGKAGLLVLIGIDFATYKPNM